jgi:hypothetical protein
MLLKTNRISAVLFILLLCPGIWLVPLWGQETNPGDELRPHTKTTVPGTGINIALPEAFAYDAEQSAFIYPGAAASIYFREIPGTPCHMLTSDATLQHLEQQGIIVSESQGFATESGLKGTVYFGSFSAVASNGSPADFDRIICFTGNSDMCVWITINYPAFAGELLKDMLLACLQTIDLK